MDEVRGVVTRAALDLSHAAGLPMDELLAGLPFDRKSIRRMRWVRWEDHRVLVERMSIAAGGHEQLRQLVARADPTILPPELRAVLAPVGTPKQPYRSFF